MSCSSLEPSADCSPHLICLLSQATALLPSWIYLWASLPLLAAVIPPRHVIILSAAPVPPVHPGGLTRKPIPS